MTSFFDATAPTDEHYRFFAHQSVPRAIKGRVYLEALWERTGAFLDQDVRSKAASGAFQQVFWEMYLCEALLELSLPLMAGGNKKRQNGGPDFQIGGVEAWVEAIAVTGGSGKDAVPSLRPARTPGEVVVGHVPEDKIKLRLIHALDAKRKKFETYQERGWVSPDEPRVVAINAALVPNAGLGLGMPTIVSSVFPFGPMAVPFETVEDEFGEEYYTLQESVEKSAGSPVPTSAFLDERFSSISALIFSTVRPLSPRMRTGADFVVIHNPLASTPLPRGYFSIGREYWKHGPRLEWRDHPAT